MFVQHLNKRQQVALLSLADKLIKSDGNVNNRERKLLAELKSYCQDGVKAESRMTLSTIENLFPGGKQKISLLLELIGLAKIDRKFAPSERRLIKNVAKKIDVSEGLLNDLENWVDRQALLVEEVDLLMESL